MISRKLKVLIVEDSGLIKDRIISVLNDHERVGQISSAGTYSEALSHVEKEVPDLVILDIGLPDRSGIYLLQEIRRREWPVTVIVFTNEANEFYKKLCLRMGADAFLDKSNDFGKITEIISNIP